MQTGLIGLGAARKVTSRRLIKAGRPFVSGIPARTCGPLTVEDAPAASTFEALIRRLKERAARPRAVRLIAPAGEVTQYAAATWSHWLDRGGVIIESDSSGASHILTAERQEAAGGGRCGGVIASWLLDLSAATLVKDPDSGPHSGLIQEFVADPGNPRRTPDRTRGRAQEGAGEASLQAPLGSLESRSFGVQTGLGMGAGLGGLIDAMRRIDPFGPPIERRSEPGGERAADE
jgi:6-phosphogluconate dehydrogenase (decarboxylating)